MFDEISILAYCYDVLCERTENTLGESWMWEYKKAKVSELLTNLDDQFPDLEQSSKLSSKEKQYIKDTHPLLKEDMDPSDDSEECISHAVWFQRLNQMLENSSSEMLKIANEISILKYCVFVLEQRMIEDVSFFWLWQQKKKVAKGMIKFLADNCQYYFEELEPDLTDEDKTLIQESHPLLQKKVTDSGESFHRKYQEWFDEIQKKIRGFMNKRSSG